MDKPADATAAPPQSQPPPENETAKATQQNQTHFQEVSIVNLRKLSDAFSGFQRCFTELQLHVDSIQTSIDSLLPINTTPLPASSPPAVTSPAPVPEPSCESDPYEEVKEEEKEVKLTLSELEHLCETMCSRSVKKYIIMNLSDQIKLREEVPKALKLARNPARLVLNCCGKFFLQGSRAYVKGSHMISAREASVLILECYLLMGIEGVKIDDWEKDEAEQSAVAWRNRLISEGGVGKACAMDARGLLLLIGCFGIPKVFRNDDIVDLLQLSNPKEIFDALRRSKVLMTKIPDIIEGMVKHKMEVHAVDIAYTFGVEDRVNPPRLLKTFLQRTKKPAKRPDGSLVALNDAKRKRLSDLKSVIKCLEINNLDPSKLLPGLHVNEQVMALEKEIAELDKQLGEGMAQKRKFDESESSRRFSNKEVKLSHILPPWPQQQRVVNYVDSNSTLLEGGTAGNIYGHSMVLHGPVAGSRHENVGPLAGTVGGVAMGGVGAGISVGMDGQHGGSYAGGRGGTLVDSIAGQVGSQTGQLYGWHGDAPVYDKLTSHSYAYRPPLSGLPNTIPSDVGGQSSASNIYQVADTVAASVLYRSSGSRMVDAVPSAAPAHPSSFLYWSR